MPSGTELSNYKKGSSSTLLGKALQHGQRPEELKMMCTLVSKPKRLNVARPGSAPHKFLHCEGLYLVW